jgi:hypothetical protein
MAGVLNIILSVVAAFFVLVGPIALALGGVMLLAARRRQPDGTQTLRRCAGCSYPTYGLTSVYCPECGANREQTGTLPPVQQVTMPSMGRLGGVLFGLGMLMTPLGLIMILFAGV